MGRCMKRRIEVKDKDENLAKVSFVLCRKYLDINKKRNVYAEKVKSIKSSKSSSLKDSERYTAGSVTRSKYKSGADIELEIQRLRMKENLNKELAEKQAQRKEEKKEFIAKPIYSQWGRYVSDNKPTCEKYLMKIAKLESEL